MGALSDALAAVTRESQPGANLTGFHNCQLGSDKDEYSLSAHRRQRLVTQCGVSADRADVLSAFVWEARNE